MFIQTWRSTFPIVPFHNARQGWSARESLLLELTCPATGVSGLGEASPLAGFSPESMDAVERALLGVNLENPHLQLPLSELLTAVASTPLPPSARFALETALLDGVSQVRRVPIEQLLGQLLEQLRLQRSLGEPASTSDFSQWSAEVSLEAAARTASTPTAEVIDLLDADYIERALDGHSRGGLVFKVKVGSDLVRETSLLRTWSERFRAEDKAFRFRLDANRSLTEAQFDLCCDWWRALPVEYVEEPCPLNVLRSLFARPTLPLPIALDETLSEGQAALGPWLGRISALVCKPMYLGGITPVLEWARLARSHGLPIVVSHLLDGALAMRLYRALARVVGPNTVAGLGPHPGLTLWSNHLQPRTNGLGLGLERRRVAV